MRLKVIAVWILIICLLSGCTSWYRKGVKIENAKKDCKLAMQTDDFEYSMFLRGYKKEKPPKGTKQKTFLCKGRLITVAGE